jgi:large subunit ribosomal protein L17
MRHHNNVRKFGRDKNQRKALLKGLALSLIKKEKIMTTEAKAKELRPYIEKMITQAKGGTSVERRLLNMKLMNRAPEVKKLLETIAPRYTARSGGYSRIMKLPARKSDGALMAIIELV